MSDELEQYKLYVEMTDVISERRVTKNRFYVTLLTGLIAILPILTSIQALERSTVGANGMFLIIGLLGIALIGAWLLDIRAFLRLRQIKFDVINEIEEQKRVPIDFYIRERNKLRDRYGKPREGGGQSAESEKKNGGQSEGPENKRLNKRVFCERTISEWIAPALLIIPYVALIAIACLSFLR